jgi:hypothetical protein
MNELGSLVGATMSGKASFLPNASPELRLLAWLCTSSLSRASLPTVGTAGIDWSHFSALARHHRIAPVVWRNLSDRPDLDIPSNAKRDLAEQHRANALHCMRTAAHLMRIVEALAKVGIPTLPLKGVCLAALYYHDIASRHVGDVDLLVAPTHLSRANQIMRELGYNRVSNDKRTVMKEPFEEANYFRLHSMYVGNDGIVVEMHFQLHFNPAILPINVKDVVARGATVSLGRAVLPVMPTALQFVFLATHGARHEWIRLQWIYDIAAMVDRASDAEVREWLKTAAHHRLTNPVVQALVIAERHFGVPLPAEVIRAYRGSLRIRYMVSRAEKAINSDPSGPPLPEPQFKLGRRLYRMCVTSRPAYLWHEFRNGVGALFTRLMKPSAVF